MCPRVYQGNGRSSAWGKVHDLTGQFSPQIITHCSNRFANTDYALAHAIRQQRFQLGNEGADTTFFTARDHLLSYDISCSYCVNAIK